MAHGGQTAAEAPRKAASPDGPDETAGRGFWLEGQRPGRWRGYYGHRGERHGNSGANLSAPSAYAKHSSLNLRPRPSKSGVFSGSAQPDIESPDLMRLTRRRAETRRSISAHSYARPITKRGLPTSVIAVASSPGRSNCPAPRLCASNAYEADQDTAVPAGIRRNIRYRLERAGEVASSLAQIAQAAQDAFAKLGEAA